MNRFIRTAKTPAVVLATILAVGILLAWTFAMLVGQNFSAFFTMQSQDPSESLSITREGKAYVQHHVADSNTSHFRTLEGQPIDPAIFLPTSPDTHYGAPEMVSFNAPLEEPNRPQRLLDWSQRIVGFCNHSTQPDYWYLVRDELSNGSAYLVGYDRRSKRIIGYIGRAGFRPDEPPTDDRFPECVDDRYSHSAAYGTEPSSGPAVESLVYFISDGQLIAVDIDRRTVRTIQLSSRPVALDDYQETLLQAKDVPDVRTFVPQQAVATAVRTAVRTTDEIVVLDAKGNTIRRQPIPKLLQDKVFSMYFCEKELVFRTGNPPAADDPDVLYWVNDQGEIARQTEVRLLRPSYQSNPRTDAWQTAAMIPVPGLMAMGTLLQTPWNNVATGKSPDYFTALGRSLSDVWPAFVALMAVGAVMSLWVFRRHRSINPRGATTWAVFVFLAGVPGILAYWLHRYWPTKEKCAQCGKLAPRDREECLACGEGFPTPRPVGTDIYA